MEIKKSTEAALLAQMNKQIQDLHHHMYPQLFKQYDNPSMQDHFERSFQNEAITNYIVWVDQTPAAYFQVESIQYAETQGKKQYTVLYLHQICVLEEHRKKSIGNTIINFIQTLAKEENISRLELDFWTKNTIARQFFTNAGFTNFNERMFLEI